MRLSSFVCLLLLVTSVGAQDTYIGVSVGDSFDFQIHSNEPFYLDSEGEIEISNGETITLTVDELPQGNDKEITYSMMKGDNEIKLSDVLDKYGQYIIFPDWEYWQDSSNLGAITRYGQLLVNPSAPDEQVQLNQTRDNFSYNLTMNGDNTTILFQSIYRLNGVLNYLHYKMVNLIDSTIISEYSIQRDFSLDDMQYMADFPALLVVGISLLFFSFKRRKSPLR